VGRYGGAAPAATETAVVPIVLVGLRACELRALEYLDKVMLDGAFEDPLYHQRRRQTTAISCDCVDCAGTCFCPLVGGKPFPEEGYDVNLTALGDGFLAEVATDSGHRWLVSSGDAPARAQHAVDQFLAAPPGARVAVIPDGPYTMLRPDALRAKAPEE
jgi:hypothetical protein